jgi:hypothetical protein
MDIKKSAKAGQLVRALAIYPLPFPPVLSFLVDLLKHLHAERMQGHGKGPGSHAPICPKVLPDAHATAGGRTAHTDVTK